MLYPQYGDRIVYFVTSFHPTYIQDVEALDPGASEPADRGVRDNVSGDDGRQSVSQSAMTSAE